MHDDNVRFRVMPPIEHTDKYWTVYRGSELYCLCPTHDAAWTIADALEALATLQKHPRQSSDFMNAVKRIEESFDGEQ